MDVLTVQAISRWLIGIHMSRLAPEKRPLARALQIKAEEVFTSYFFKTETEQVSQPIAPPTQRPTQAKRKLHQPARPAQEGIVEELADIKAAIRRLEARLDGMQADVDEVKAALRGIQQKQQDIEARMRAQTLTFEAFQAQMDVRVAWLERWLRVAAAAREMTPIDPEMLAPLTTVVANSRLVAAVVERLLLLEEWVSRLEPKPPPPPTRRGRPRRDRRH